MSLNIKDFKRPQNIVGVASYDGMYDRYTIALRWEWNGEQMGYNRVINADILGATKVDIVKETCKLMVDEICAGADWTEDQETHFRYNAGKVFEKICDSIKKNKTNIKVTSNEIKWATGNMVAQKLKYLGNGTPTVGPKTVGANIGEIAKHLPGVMTNVPAPKWCTSVGAAAAGGCSTGPNAVYYLVQHLNDYHKLSREVIADWIDELHDTGKMNAEFKPWGEEDSQSTDNCDTIEEEGTKLTPLYQGELVAKPLKPGEVPPLEDIYNKSKELDPWPANWVDVGYTTDSKVEYDFDNMTMDEIAAALLDAHDKMTLSELKNLNEQVNKFVDAAGLTTEEMHKLLKALKEEK